MKAFISFIILASVVALALALGASNEQVVDVNYLVAQSSVKLTHLVIGALVTGFAVALLAMGTVLFKLKLTVRRLSRKSERQHTELEKLRTNVTKG